MAPWSRKLPTDKYRLPALGNRILPRIPTANKQAKAEKEMVAVDGTLGMARVGEEAVVGEISVPEGG